MIQTYSQNMLYKLLFHGKNGYANASESYVIRTLSVHFKIPDINVMSLGAIRKPHVYFLHSVVTAMQHANL